MATTRLGFPKEMNSHPTNAPTINKTNCSCKAKVRKFCYMCTRPLCVHSCTCVNEIRVNEEVIYARAAKRKAATAFKDGIDFVARNTRVSSLNTVIFL